MNEQRERIERFRTFEDVNARTETEFARLRWKNRNYSGKRVG